MPRFKVEIRGDELMRVVTALNAVGIPTIGPVSAGYGDPASWTVDTEMAARVDAQTPERAKARVEESLPPNRDWTVLDAEPWSSTES
jgi:hypothetical protein